MLQRTSSQISKALPASSCIPGFERVALTLHPAEKKQRYFVSAVPDLSVGKWAK